MVESSHSRHSYSVISEDKPSDIPSKFSISTVSSLTTVPFQSLQSDSPYFDYSVKRSPPLPSMGSDSSTEEDEAADFLADPPPKELPIPLPSKPVESEEPIPETKADPKPEPEKVPEPKPEPEAVSEPKPVPEEPKPDPETVSEPKPDEKVIPETDTKPVPESEPVETKEEEPVEIKDDAPEAGDTVESETMKSIPDEPAQEPESTEPDDGDGKESNVDPIIEKDPTESAVTDEPITEKMKTTVMDEITTRISLSTSKPLPGPVPIPPDHDQIDTTWKDTISTTMESVS